MCALIITCPRLSHKVRQCTMACFPHPTLGLGPHAVPHLYATARDRDFGEGADGGARADGAHKDWLTQATITQVSHHKIEAP